MRRLVVIALLALSAVPAQAQVAGWRGDGTGCFPNADPPTEWMKVSRVMGGLRAQASRPAGDSPAGTPAPFGSVTEWLVLGPLKPATAKPLDEDLLGGEATVEPDIGVKAQDAQWKKHVPEGGLVDFVELFGKDARGVAYAHAYLYAATGGDVLLQFVQHDKRKCWLNGLPAGPRATLKPGWNRLLVKTVWGPNRSSAAVFPSVWHFGMRITAAPPFETQTKNVAWATRLPWGKGIPTAPALATGLASPVIAGDRLFVMADPWDLFCLRKSDGRILWVRTNSFYDALSDEEKKSPAYRGVAPLAARLNEINEAFTRPEWPDRKLVDEKCALQKKIFDLMAKADAKYAVKFGEYHSLVSGTPATDGKHVWVWTGVGVTACYDLDGNREWIVADLHGIQHRGHNSSPILVNGKFIVHMKDLTCFDAATGKVLWTLDVCGGSYTSRYFHDSVVGFKVAGEDYVFVWGQIVRVKDGARVWENEKWREDRTVPTPVVSDGTIYDLTTAGWLHRATLPRSADDMSLVDTGRNYAFGFQTDRRTGIAASPLVHDGLVYIVDYMGRLTVVDAKTLDVVYTKDLGFGMEVGTSVFNYATCFSSPALVGGNIVVLGLAGTSVVFEPGRRFRLVARNRIEDVTDPGTRDERPESFTPSPLAEGNRLYIRGSAYVYCIGK